MMTMIATMIFFFCTTLIITHAIPCFELSNPRVRKMKIGVSQEEAQQENLSLDLIMECLLSVQKKTDLHLSREMSSSSSKSSS